MLCGLRMMKDLVRLRPSGSRFESRWVAANASRWVIANAGGLLIFCSPCERSIAVASRCVIENASHWVIAEFPLTELRLGANLGDSLSRELRAEHDSTAPVDDGGRETAGEGTVADLLLAFICPAPPSTWNWLALI